MLMNCREYIGTRSSSFRSLWSRGDSLPDAIYISSKGVDANRGLRAMLGGVESERRKRILNSLKDNLVNMSVRLTRGIKLLALVLILTSTASTTQIRVPLGTRSCIARDQSTCKRSIPRMRPAPTGSGGRYLKGSLALRYMTATLSPIC